MSGGGMGATAPTQSAPQAQMGALGPTQGAIPPSGGLPMSDGSAPAQQQASPMIQQMQSQPQMQNPYAAQQMYRPQMMQQQPMYRPQMAQQSQYGGLQALLNNLVNRYQQPQQRFSQMPRYQNPALAYRPNLSQAQASLGRTATTKAEAQAAAEEAALAKIRREQGFLNINNPFDNQNYGNG